MPQMMTQESSRAIGDLRVTPRPCLGELNVLPLLYQASNFAWLSQYLKHLIFEMDRTKKVLNISITLKLLFTFSGRVSPRAPHNLL
jgi:hypothetical protein